jgi:hypothetical protein
MNDDGLLADAMGALRDSTDGSHAHAARTRMLILARVRERARRRRRVAFVLLPLAATLVISTAWGAVTGSLPRWLDAVTGRAPTRSAAVAGVQPPIPAPTSGPQPAFTSIDPAAAGEPPPLEVGSPPATVPTIPATPSHVSSSPAGAAAARASAAVSAREQALYATAHEAHFVDHDPAAALRGWDAYLAPFPDGRFALEARYNRAITLVRLGRHAEARDALAPFAAGRYAGYRRAEARELLDALAAADGGPPETP